MSTGRKCDFQSPVSQVLEATTKDQSSHPTNLRINQLSIVPLNARDASHFDYFITICSKEFSLYFESSLWESIILQAACSDLCIRHAALAIGALSRNNHLSQSSEPGLEYAMKQYNLALRALNNALDKSARSCELSILGSIAFIAFEVLWGVDTRVRMHLGGALAMLGSLSENGDDDSSLLAAGRKHHRRIGLGSDTDLGYLVSALSQLSGQVSSFETLSDWNASREGRA
jgi:hypothetical protein